MTVAEPEQTVSPSRRRFIEAVDATFSAAGISYAVLHGYEHLTADSDVDVVVGREDVPLVDALVRAGALGPLLQVIAYDIPWCRYYVVATGDEQRPYRQLDVSCDPWGLSMLGRSLRVALESASGGPRSRPTAAAEALLLLAKRAHKGLRRPGEASALAAAYRRDPAGARHLFEAEAGAAGAEAADEAAAGSISGHALDLVWHAMLRRRRRPLLLARRTRFSAARVAERLRRPTGLAVVIAGPDGTGKSTLADALPDAVDGLFWRSVRLHVGPQLLPRPGRLLGRPPADTSAPHARPPSRALPSLARLAYLLGDALLAWAPQVALPKRRSGLVLIERGWRDLEIDPRRYRLGLPAGFIRASALLLPRPDLVLLLDAPGEVVRSRKGELSDVETARQARSWRAAAAREPGRYVLLDATGGPDEVVGAARAAIEARLAQRNGGLSRLALALGVLGGIRADGAPHLLAGVRGETRWVLPAHVGAPGPAALGLYRPFRRAHALAAAGLEVRHRCGVTRQRRVPLATERGLARVVARRLAVADVELAAAATSDATRGQRAVVSVRTDGRVVAFAKVAVEHADALQHEARVLAAVAAAAPRVIRPPRILDCFTWNESTVLLLEALPVRGPTDRPLGALEVAALVELRQLAEVLAPALGREVSAPAVHGDFTPWNSTPLPGGLLALWDWEEARLGLPLEDYFNWQVARSLRGRGTLHDLIADIDTPGSLTDVVAGRLGVTPEGARAALRRYLEVTLGTPPRSAHPGVPAFRAEALALIGDDR